MKKLYAILFLFCAVTATASTESEKLNFQGNNLGLEGKFSQAEAKFTTAIEIDPNYHEPWYNRGKARLNLKKYKKAISDFNKALTLYIDPNGIADVLNNRGIAKKKSGDLWGAIADYNRALEQNPNLYRVYVNRGLAYYELGMKKKAVRDFRISKDHGIEKGAEALNQLGVE